MLDAVVAVLFVGVQDDFGVGSRDEAMTLPLQGFSEFDVVEDLAVESHHQRAILAVHRLPTATQIDYAQPGVAQPNRAVDRHAASVRPPMPNRFQHPPQ